MCVRAHLHFSPEESSDLAAIEDTNQLFAGC